MPAYPTPLAPISQDSTASSPEFGLSAASFAIAVLALLGTVTQLNWQASAEARRRGKIDRLALGDWAFGWPQAKLPIFLICRFLGLPAPWSDPRIMTVPFITVGAMETYLRDEATAMRREPLARRMPHRLVESASNTIATGDGNYSGRMYNVRPVTLKRCEACWADALDMCGMARDFWPESLMTPISAQGCDGAVRPANAVTNLHSLCGIGRIMGMRRLDRAGSRITVTNGGASLHLDLSTGANKPIRLAHFSGSPNGRYLIVDEMSQHTGQSIYADAVWASGHVPDERRLSFSSHNHGAPADSSFSRTTLLFPAKFPTLQAASTVTRGETNASIDGWAADMAKELETVCNSERVMDVLRLIKTPVVISCIRTFPVGDLQIPQLTACYQALLWCTRYWWLCPYQQQQQNILRPRLPILGTAYIGPEYITDVDQAEKWCEMAMKSEGALVDDRPWQRITQFAEEKAASRLANKKKAVTLTVPDHLTIVKILQCWKLMLYVKRSSDETTDAVLATAVLATLTMACVAVATDTVAIGDPEVNKAMEIELGHSCD